MTNKPIKVYFHGKRLKDIYPHATGWQVFKYKVRKFLRKVFITAVIIASIVGIFKLGGILNPATIVTKAEIIKEVEVKAPILDRIAKCESPTGHWKNGQVVMRSNKDHSVDVGKYQINNSAWGAKATELGLNLTVEKDNEAMAIWIYKNRGTGDWYASKDCWMK